MENLENLSVHSFPVLLFQGLGFALFTITFHIPLPPDTKLFPVPVGVFEMLRFVIVAPFNFSHTFFAYHACCNSAVRRP